MKRQAQIVSIYLKCTLPCKLECFALVCLYSWVSKDNNKILNENKKNCCQISGYATNAKAQPIAVSLSKKLEYLDKFSRRHRYVSRNDIDQLLQTIEKGKINLPQSLTVIKYFGKPNLKIL